VNTPGIIPENSFTKSQRRFHSVALTLVASLLASLGLALFASPASAEWKVDFSRRSKSVRDADLDAAGQSSSPSRGPASVRAADDSGGSSAQTPPDIAASEQDDSKGLFDTIFDTGTAVTDLVILNTEKGFVPSTVRVRKNGKYKVTIVNVNDKEKNVSFILDGFSEHHATYFGKTKSFFLEPKKEGVFSFQSPETAAEGKLIVFNPQITVRTPAAAGATTK
jgi:hypothetical protein